MCDTDSRNPQPSPTEDRSEGALMESNRQLKELAQRLHDRCSSLETQVLGLRIISLFLGATTFVLIAIILLEGITR